jgi:hypothetical protein
VTYTATPFRPATFHDPASGGEVEVETICVSGHDLTDLVSEATRSAIHAYLVDHVGEWSRDDADSAAEDAAEYRRAMLREAA